MCDYLISLSYVIVLISVIVFLILSVIFFNFEIVSDFLFVCFGLFICCVDCCEIGFYYGVYIDLEFLLYRLGWCGVYRDLLLFFECWV